MPLYAILCTDKPAAAALRAATRERHLAHLRAADSPVKLAGAFLGEDGTPTGSLITIEAADHEAAAAFAARDPYVEAGVFQTVEIKPLRLAIGEL